MGSANGNASCALTTIAGDETAPFYLDATRIVFARPVGGGGLAIVAPTGGTVDEDSAVARRRNARLAPTRREVLGRDRRRGRVRSPGGP